MAQDAHGIAPFCALYAFGRKGESAKDLSYSRKKPLTRPFPRCILPAGGVGAQRGGFMGIRKYVMIGLWLLSAPLVQPALVEPALAADSGLKIATFQTD